LTFDEFSHRVLTTNGDRPFAETEVNTYVTQGSQVIRFTISPQTDIVSTTEGFEPDGFRGKFAHGSIIDSATGSGVIEIRGPAGGPTITLNLSDRFRPVRISESGFTEVAGGNHEVWVDFNSAVGTVAGDFYAPFHTLAAARDAVAVGGTINIVPGTRIEPIVITKRLTLKSFPGSAIIAGRE
jgi:hypothetical protein